MISIVIPALNEERNISTVIRSIRKSMSRPRDYEIVVVDGNSSDGTVSMARRLGARIIKESRGKGNALRKGVEACIGEYIITMDADCSHASGEISMLTEKLRKGYDICMGSRFMEGGGTDDMPWHRMAGNKIFVCIVNRLWGANYTDLCYGYRSFRKDIFNRLGLKSNGFGIETEISIRAAKKGMKTIEVPSFEEARREGEGKLKSLRDGMDISLTMIREIVRRD